VLRLGGFRDRPVVLPCLDDRFSVRVREEQVGARGFDRV